MREPTACILRQLKRARIDEHFEDGPSRMDSHHGVEKVHLDTVWPLDRLPVVEPLLQEGSGAHSAEPSRRRRPPV